MYIWICLFFRYLYMDMDMFRYVYMDLDIFRYVYMDTLGKLKWKKVGALTEDGQKYSDYISDMQVYIITVLNIRIRIQRGTNLTKKILKISLKPDGKREIVKNKMLMTWTRIRI